MKLWRLAFTVWFLLSAAFPQSITLSGGARLEGVVEFGAKPSSGATYIDTGFEDGTISPFGTSCRQNPGNVACNETTNKSCAVDPTVAYEGSKSVLCEASIDPGVDYSWKNELIKTLSIPKNPAVTDGALWYGFAFRFNADMITCISSGTVQHNQVKLTLARPTSGGGGWSMPLFGQLQGGAPNDDDLNFNADGFGIALTPDTASQQLFDLEPDTWYEIKMYLTRDINDSRGTVRFYYKNSDGDWVQANWNTSTDAIIESPNNNQHTNANHGWNDEAIAQKLEIAWATLEPDGTGNDCAGRVGKMWVDKVWAANYDKY